MASKLNFRARTLDASKPMAIYNMEDLPELTDLNAINRSVPAMPSGMEKEEESEKHLQDILDAQSSQKALTDDTSKTLVIPTPEVFDSGLNDKKSLFLYTKGYKVPRQYIHVQPFSMDAEKPDYDLDEEDSDFVKQMLRNEKKFEIDLSTFEEMIDRLEKSSGHNVITAKEAKLLLKEDDDLILAVYDYWVEKRLRIKQPLLPLVKSDKRDIGHQPSGQASSSGSGALNNTPGMPGNSAMISGGSGSVLGSAATANITNTNPYIAFRRRTEKMQTRKNRKNDEASYEKMLKLRRDLSRAVVLLEMVKRREKTKKENLTLTAEIFDKRYSAGDYEGKVIAEVQAQKPPKVLQPNQYFPNRFTENWIANSGQRGANASFYKHDKKSKKRKKSGATGQNPSTSTSGALGIGPGGGGGSTNMLYNSYVTPFQSDDDGFSANGGISSDYEDDPADAPFAFRRKANVQYLAPKVMDFTTSETSSVTDQWPSFNVLNSSKEPRFRYSYASLSNPSPRFLGRIRRRVGRGGRCVLDRIFHQINNGEISLSPNSGINSEEACIRENLPHFRPVTPPHVKEDRDPWDLTGQFNDALSFPSKPVRMLPGSIPAASVAAGASTSTSSSLIERQRSVSGMGTVKTVSVDSVGAQNAASALVTNNLMDIFGK